MLLEDINDSQAVVFSGLERPTRDLIEAVQAIDSRVTKSLSKRESKISSLLVLWWNIKMYYNIEYYDIQYAADRTKLTTKIFIHYIVDCNFLSKNIVSIFKSCNPDFEIIPLFYWMWDNMKHKSANFVQKSVIGFTEFVSIFFMPCTVFSYNTWSWIIWSLWIWYWPGQGIRRLCSADISTILLSFSVVLCKANRLF